MVSGFACCLPPYMLQICGHSFLEVRDERDFCLYCIPKVWVLEGQEVRTLKGHHQLILQGGLDHMAIFIELAGLCMLLKYLILLAWKRPCWFCGCASWFGWAFEWVHREAGVLVWW